MSILVDRTCTEVTEEAGGASQAQSKPLSAFRDCGAYVLLGAPGAGKTTSFKQEVAEDVYCDARDFINYDRYSGVETLFIDGLDEERAGSTDGRTPLNTILQKLDKLRPRRFRLSCREADWFGAADRRRLESVSPDGAVKVLRLDSLSEDNVRAILDGEVVKDVDGFIDKARDRGLGALLSNPQTLKLLVATVADGNWPATRTDTFEAACTTLIPELNQDHLQAVSQHSDSELLHTAGRLCAIQLLTGRRGYRLPMAIDNVDGYIGLRDIREPNQETLLATVHTKMFQIADGLATPIHRHIAEFLAGRYLSRLIEDMLPVERVLALLTGYDGRIVSELRGLAAWLAAHCREARHEVVERDPLGTVLYGDVKRFGVDEKRRLLDCLERDAQCDVQIMTAMHDLDFRWDDLATPDMEYAFRKILTTTKGTQGKQTVALVILRSLVRGAVVPSLAPMLLDIVRNGECWPAVRETALDAYFQQKRDQDKAPDDTLKTLLTDIQQGLVAEGHDDLLGRLLGELYPTRLHPSETGRYLRERENVTFGGPYRRFWEHDVAERSTNDQFAGVLDSIVETFGGRDWSGKKGKLSSYWSRTIPAKLLAAYLTRSPTVNHERLFAWLDFGAASADDDAGATLNVWFYKNPESYKAVVRLAAERYSESPHRIQEIYSRLPTEAEPADFGEWCLSQIKTETSKIAVHDFLLGRIIARQDHEKISEETVEECLAHDPRLLAKYRELRKPREINAREAASQLEVFERRDAQEEAATKKRQKVWYEAVRAQESALRENRAAPKLLHQLVSVYGDTLFPVPGARGRLLLRRRLGSDELVDTVIQAFRASPMRADLPDETEIFRLADEKKYHLLMLPFLVGLDESSLLYPGKPPLDEQGMRRALAFRFGAPNFWSQEPRWYRPILTCRPDLVADVLVRSVRAHLRRGETSCLGLYELGHDKHHNAVAYIAVVPLLESFPTRCKVEQLKMLKHLLHAGFQHVPRHELLQIIESKLALRSMDAAQRVYWMCAGLLVAPTSFTDRLRQALTGRGHERRVRRMAEFLYDGNSPSIDALDVLTLELLIESFGGSCRPLLWVDDGFGMLGTMPSRDDLIYTPSLVDALITTLSSEPSHDATDALERLSAENSLRPWQLKLQDAASRQRGVRREVDYRQPSVEQILETLDNLLPANAADLAALTMYVLGELARTIRHGSTSDWRQYWNRDGYERPKPMPENDGRDRLLSDIKARFDRLNVSAEPEGTYADDRRADIRVSCDGFNVPIEIKKSTHDDLWRAIRYQLIAKYTRDPGADGYGIYLVFWFGPDRCKRPPTGPPPETPAALRDQLLATATLSPEERRKISVIVIDVSKPDPQSGRMSP